MESKMLSFIIVSTFCVLQSGQAVEVIKMTGDNITLNCNTVGAIPNWKYPEELINSTRLEISYQFTQLAGKNQCNSTLTVQAANIDDSGVYYCVTSKTTKRSRGSTNQGDIVKQYNVFVSDNRTLITNAPNMIQVTEGEDLRLPCRATVKNVNVLLTKKPSGRYDYSRVGFDAAKGYIVRNVGIADEGHWECAAQHGKLKTTRMIYVLLQRRQPPVSRVQNSKPQSQGNAVEETKLIAIPSNRVLAGDVMTLRCEAESKEMTRALLEWNSTNVGGFERFSPTNHIWRENEDARQMKPIIEPRKGYFITWSERRVSNIKVSDAGTYYCIIKSQTGQVKNLATKIDVVERPFINVENSGLIKNGSGYFVQAIRGLPTSFEFKVNAFPPPVFLIYRNGRGLSKEWMQKHTLEFESADYVVFVIHFNETRLDNAGDYTLGIKSQKRNKKKRLIRKTIRFTVKVGDPTVPVIEEDEVWDKEKKTAIIGEALQLSCSVSGIPYPSIKWYKDNIWAGNTSSLVILKVSDKDSGNYTCTATNTVGEVSRSVIVKTRKSHQKFKLGFTIAVPICGLFIIAVGFALYLKSKRMREMKQQMKIHMKYLAPILDTAGAEADESHGEQPYDSKKWEIPRDRLKLGKTIGRGAFGRVVQATAYDIDETSSCKTVAVKMLKAGCRNSEFQALMSELKILIHMGPHLNIVNLHGACTTTEGPVMIVVEYCRFGNMSNYLRKHRSTYIARTRKRRNVSKEYDNDTKQRASTDEGENADVFPISEEIMDCCEEHRCQVKWNHGGKQASETSSLSSTSNSVSRDDDEGCQTRTRLSYSCSVTSKESIKKASRKGYEEDKEFEAKTILTESNLLSYSYQVARGMEFLASRKCIHRDVAARNILVADGDVVKICDFGLARDVYHDPDYVRNGEARLPLKWMALESIFDKVYSTKSDVWSFGILLWEIFSLGASPYPGSVMNEEFFNELKRGVRMQKPAHAPDRVYDSMLACWSQNPDDRPTFTKLAEEFSSILEDKCGSDYLDTLRIFEQNPEDCKTRKIAPVRRPEETFHENNSNIVSSRHNEHATRMGNGEIMGNSAVESIPLIMDSNDSIQPAETEDCNSLARSDYRSPSNSQRPSIDVGINSSANETPPPYNAIVAV